MSGLVSKAPPKKEKDNEQAAEVPNGKKPRKPMGGRKSEKEVLASSISDTIDQWQQEESIIPEDEPYSVEKVPIGDIRLDPDNHRTRHINEFAPTEITLPEDHPDYEETVDLVEGLKVFAEHLKHQPMQSPIKVYKDRNRYWTGPGSRRWLASKIAFGDKTLIRVHVYETKPANLATSRFVENNQREDTSLYVRILDLRTAVQEQHKAGVTIGKDIAVNLGLSASTYSKLSRVSDDEIVMENFIAPRRVSSLNIASKLVGCKTVEEAEAKYARLSFTGKKGQATPKKTVGRKKEVVRVPPFKDMRVARALVSGEIFKTVDWNDEDLESVDAFQVKLELCIKNYIEKLQKG